MPRSLHHDHSAQWSREVFQKAWECGLVNLHIPKQYGGRGLGGIEGVIACEEMAFADIGMMIGMEINSVAEVPVILAGTEEQKRSFLGRMTANPLQAAYAVTEPGAGSDVAGVQTRADKKGDEWVLNGSKMWISNGGVANWYFVLARTGAAGDPAGSAFTAFLVERDSPGVSVGKKEAMMGQRCSDTRAVTFSDVRVPASRVLGGVGKGFKIAMAAFDFTRPPVAASALGLARRALQETLAHVRSLMRPDSTVQSPAAHDVAQSDAFLLADMATGIEAARLLTYNSAWLTDQGLPNTAQASMAKLVASEHCKTVVSSALQIIGREGLSAGSVPEKLFRDAPILTTYEGTSQIQRLIISRELMLAFSRTN